MYNRIKYIIMICLQFLIGSLTLILCSFIQKYIAGFALFKWNGYLIPFLYGGVTGIIIGIYILRAKKFIRKYEQRVNELELILPICVYCKRIRKPDSDPEKMDSWEKIEVYISNKTASQFSHSICPECMKKVYKDIPNMSDKGNTK